MKRSRLNPRSKQPRKYRDLELQQHYRDQNSVCELTPWLVRNLPGVADTNDYSLHLHHICGGNGGRYDFWSNFIRVSGTVHDWIHANPIEGKVLCLFVKLKKNELNLEEFRLCSGRNLEGIACPSLPELAELHRDLLTHTHQD